jgi:HEAT repeat protein
VTCSFPQAHLELLQAAKGIPDFERLAVNEPNENVRWAALHALIDLADCNPAEVLTHVLDDSSESNRALAALMLERVKSGTTCEDVNSAK